MMRRTISLDEGQDKAIMIVDSSPTMQDLFRKGLKKIGYRVLLISDPVRALQRCELEDHVADCVVIGCYSLGKAGLEAFNRFGQHDHTRNIPAILLLAEKQAGYAREAMLNDHRVVAKMPLKMREFRQMLKKLLSQTPVG